MFSGCLPLQTDRVTPITTITIFLVSNFFGFFWNPLLLAAVPFTASNEEEEEEKEEEDEKE